MSCSTHWDNEHVVISYNQLPLYPKLGCGYPNIEEIHHIEFTKDHNTFGFAICRGAGYNITLQVIDIAKGGAADRAGLRVRDIYLIINRGCGL